MNKKRMGVNRQQANLAKERQYDKNYANANGVPVDYFENGGVAGTKALNGKINFTKVRTRRD